MSSVDESLKPKLTDRAVVPGINEIASSKKTYIKFAAVLSIPMLLLFFLTSLARGASEGVLAAYDSPEDRVVVMIKGLTKNASATRAQAQATANELREKFPGITEIGWSLDKGVIADSDGLIEQGTIVEVREVSGTYLQVLTPDFAMSTDGECGYCVFSEGGSFLIGNGLTMGKEVGFGTSQLLAGQLTIYGGQLDVPIRDEFLSQAVIVGPAVADSLTGSQSSVARWAMRFDRRPSAEQLQELRAFIDPSDPTSVTFEAATSSGSAEETVSSLVAGSAKMMTRIGWIVLVVLSCGVAALSLAQKRVRIALMRSLGARRIDVAAQAFFVGGAYGFVGWFIAFGFASFVQGLALAYFEMLFVPLSAPLIGVALVAAVFTNAAANAAITWTVAQSDPADVIRTAAG